MSVVSQPRLGLPHLVYLTDEGVFSSACTLKTESEAVESRHSFWSLFCCCGKEAVQGMGFTRNKKFTKQLSEVGVML